MFKKILVSVVFSLAACAANAQGELLLGAQYVGQILLGNHNKEKKAQEQAQIKAKFESEKLIRDEAQARTKASNLAAERARRETQAQLASRKEALQDKRKEDIYQLELSHVRAVNKIGKNQAALSEERLVHKRKLEMLKDNYDKEIKLAAADAETERKVLTEKYKQEAMIEVDNKYHPLSDKQDINASAEASSAPSN